MGLIEINDGVGGGKWAILPTPPLAMSKSDPNKMQSNIIAMLWRL